LHYRLSDKRQSQSILFFEFKTKLIESFNHMTLSERRYCKNFLLYHHLFTRKKLLMESSNQ